MRGAHILPGCCSWVSPGAFVACRWGEAVRVGSGETQLPAPVMSTLRLVEVMSWLQATAGHSDLKLPKEVCRGQHEGFTAGKSVGLGARRQGGGSGRFWSGTGSACCRCLESLCSLPFPAIELLPSPSPASRPFLSHHPALSLSHHVILPGQDSLVVKALEAECLGSYLAPSLPAHLALGTQCCVPVLSFEVSSCFTLAEVTWLPTTGALGVSMQEVWSLPALPGLRSCHLLLTAPCTYQIKDHFLSQASCA